MKSFLVIGSLAFCFTAFAAEHVEVSPDEVLFLAHFNSKSGFEVGNGKEVVNNAEITTGGKGFPFKNVSVNEALDLAAGDRYLAVGAEGNFNPKQGTLQFLIKPQWESYGYNNCIFFHLIFDREKRTSLAWEGVNSFFIQKPPEKEQFEFIQDGNYGANYITLVTSHSKEKWYQMTVTWDSVTEERSFYIDGKLIGTKKFYVFTNPPVEIGIGGLNAWFARSLIDEVRILDRVLTADEVKQDYDALAEGKEFPVPGK